MTEDGAAPGPSPRRSGGARGPSASSGRRPSGDTSTACRTGRARRERAPGDARGARAGAGFCCGTARGVQRRHLEKPERVLPAACRTGGGPAAAAAEAIGEGGRLRGGGGFRGPARRRGAGTGGAGAGRRRRPTSPTSPTGYFDDAEDFEDDESDAEDEAAIGVGVQVEARFGGEDRYPGTVRGQCGRATIHRVHDDGDEEAFLSRRSTCVGACVAPLFWSIFDRGHAEEERARRRDRRVTVPVFQASFTRSALAAQAREIERCSDFDTVGRC